VTALLSQDPAQVLEHYADVIEGGSAYAGGDSWPGIPGTYSPDQDLPLDFVATHTVDTTSVRCTSLAAFESGRWTRDNTPGYFLRCITAGTDNVDAHRRITGWDTTTKTFTTDAWESTPEDGEGFEILHGFKRLPDAVDIEDEPFDSGFDRTFRLDAMDGEQTEWSGAGARTYRTEMRIRLRLLKYARDRTARASVLANLMILTEALTRGDQRPAALYARALMPSGPSRILREDKSKIIAERSLTLFYRVATNFR
jgi:hypothetical protein